MTDKLIDQDISTSKRSLISQSSIVTMTQDRKNTYYYKLYEQRRRHESSRKKTTRKTLNKLVRAEAARIEAETGISADRAWTAIRLAMLKAEQQFSYRRLSTHLESSQAECRRCGLQYSPSKSTIHGMVTMLQYMGKEFMDAVILGMSAQDHIGDLQGDATGFGLHKYKSWFHAKYGEISCHDYVKLHVIASVKGKILSFEVTSGTAGDSPQFKEMFERIPKGSGVVALDPAYDSYENCESIVRRGRVPVIKPAKGKDKPHGFNARSHMLEWLRERPDEFWRAYSKRATIESVFSAMKERMGSVLHSKLDGTRTVELFARVLCYNLTA